MRSRIATALLLLLSISVTAMVAGQQPISGLAPKETRGVGIEEHVGDFLPLDAQFRDDQGRKVTLGDYYEDGKPVVVVLAYYRCPMLCGLVLDGVVDSVKDMKWTAGDEYQIVVISIDPKEKVKVAQFKKQELVESYGHEGSEDGWHLLSGDQKNIDAVTEAIGFDYQYLPNRDEYSHAAAIYVTTPEGKLSRYLYGIKFDPETIRLSMVEAAAGEGRSTLDQIILFCFHYDATEGKYAVAAMNVMKGGGVLTMILLGGMLTMYFWHERLKAKTDAKTGDNHNPATAH